LQGGLFTGNSIKKNNDLKQFEHFASQISTARVVIVMGLVVMLMFLNWFLEALKWRYVTKTLIIFQFMGSRRGRFLRPYLGGYHPQPLRRIWGRVMFLPPRKRIPGIFAMGVGSFSQGRVTNVLGVISWFGLC
jgi:hypothetical protein